jgi:hypothetical protein
MDINALKNEDFAKKSSSNLLKIINELDVENQKYQAEISALLDKQDELFVVYSKIMRIIAQRSYN